MPDPDQSKKAARAAADKAKEHAGRAEAHAEEAKQDAAKAAAERAQAEAANQDFLIDTVPHDDPERALGTPGRPFSSRSPFVFGFFAAMGALLAFWLGGLVLKAGPVLVLILISVFLAAGLNPAVEWFMRRGVKRAVAVVVVTLGLLLVVTLVGVAVAPVFADQISTLITKAPKWIDQLFAQRWFNDLDHRFHVVKKVQEYLTQGNLTEKAFGGFLGVGKAVLGFLGNAFVVTVMTIYFLATLPQAKRAAYSLAPASRRTRVAFLGDRILEGVGGYVSGAFIVALCAGLSTLVFLFVIGMGEYAVALAVVVALLDVIPMIGATIGAVIVSAIAFTNGPTTGIACVVFYIAYQQIENYLIYPRVMSRAVDIPGVVTVIAALMGASLLGVVGALLAIPTAAAVLLLTKEIVVRRQDQR